MKTKNFFYLNARFFNLFFIVLLFSSTFLKGNNTDDIDNTRTILEKWVETQKVISQEKRDFEIAKEMLNERIELVQREITSLQEKIAEAEKSIAEADKKRQEMLKENEKLKNASESLKTDLVKLEDKTKKLLKGLPEPISEKIKPLSQRLPESSKKAEKNELGVSQRFQNVVGILNEVDKFNRDITITSEVRELEDGSSVEVAALYLGISHGYFANSKGTVAGIGVTEDGIWQWRTDPNWVNPISDAISILKNEKVATFVQVPVEIK